MSTMSNKAMLVSLSISMFSPKKTDKKLTREVLRDHQAAEDSGKFIKQLLPEEALEKVKKVQGQARKYLYDKSCPWTDEGARILPSMHYMEFVDKMRGFKAQFDASVDDFLASYDDFREIARGRLNGLYNSDDYPPKTDVVRKFTFKTTFLPFPEGADFRLDGAEEEMAALRQTMEVQLQEARDFARKDLVQRLAAPMRAMAERLTHPDAVFRDTLVTNLSDIVSLIGTLNVAGDGEVTALCNRVESELTRHSPETLRRSPGTRRETAAKANAILETMSGYLSAGNAPAAPPLELPPEPTTGPQDLLEAIPAPAVSDDLLQPSAPPAPPNVVALPPAHVIQELANRASTPTWRRALRSTQTIPL
jgi:hypothetical protein